MTTDPDPLLQPGERTLWRGRPRPGPTLSLGEIASLTGAAAMWCVFLYVFLFGGRGQGGGTLPPFSLAPGLAVALMPLLVAIRLAWRRGRLGRFRYMITDRRVFVVLEGPGGFVVERDLASLGDVSWESAGGGRGTILLGAGLVDRALDPDRGRFIGVDEPEKVHALLVEARAARLARNA